MQGAVEEKEPEKTIVDKLADAYKKKEPISGMINLDFTSIPQETDEKMKKVKKNLFSFFFYYAAIIAFFNFIFILINRTIIIPLILVSSCAAFICFPTKLFGHEILPAYSIGGSLLVFFILSLFIPSVIKGTVYLFAMNSFLLAIIAFHSLVIVKPEDETTAI